MSEEKHPPISEAPVSYMEKGVWVFRCSEGNEVRIDLNTGKITFKGFDTPSEAADEFWNSLSRAILRQHMRAPQSVVLQCQEAVYKLIDIVVQQSSDLRELESLVEQGKGRVIQAKKTVEDMVEFLAANSENPVDVRDEYHTVLKQRLEKAENLSKGIIT